MQQVIKHKSKVDVTQSVAGHYFLNVYRGKRFAKGLEYINYSGYAIADEIVYLQREGYTVKW